MGLAEDIAAVEKLVRTEITLLDEQLARSRRARGAAPYVYVPPSLPTIVSAKSAAALRAAEQTTPTASSTQGSSSAPSATASPSLSPAAAAADASPLQRQASSSALLDPTLNVAERAMLKSTIKCGQLYYFKKSFFGGGFEFCYLVVDEANAIRWYKSERDFATAPAKPLGQLPFFTVSTNSRGSKFKEAAVVWPLITKEECPKATDANKVYFGVQYHTPQALEHLVLCASDARERDEWVYFLTKYIALYIPASEEFQPFVGMRLGATEPLHRREVLGGEAPGSPKRTKD